MLTIGQASDVNVLLDFILGAQGAPRFADERVAGAMLRLAHNAYLPLGAGWSDTRVAEALQGYSAISVRRQKAVAA